MVSWDSKVDNFGKFSFFLNYYKVCLNNNNNNKNNNNNNKVCLINNNNNNNYSKHNNNHDKKRRVLWGRLGSKNCARYWNINILTKKYKNKPEHVLKKCKHIKKYAILRCKRITQSMWKNKIAPWTNAAFTNLKRISSERFARDSEVVWKDVV